MFVQLLYHQELFSYAGNPLTATTVLNLILIKSLLHEILRHLNLANLATFRKIAKLKCTKIKCR